MICLNTKDDIDKKTKAKVRVFEFYPALPMEIMYT